MRMYGKLVLAALAASMIIAIGVSGASARNISANERNFELIWDEALGAPKTKLEFIAGSNNVQCKVTLLGSFIERTIVKETARDQGTINHVDLENPSCTGGTVTVHNETLPWGLRYRSFTGTLPAIRSISTGLIGARFRIREPNRLECEVGTEVNHPAVGILGNTAENTEREFEINGEPLNITAERGNRIPLGGEFLCAFAGEGQFGGIGLIRNLPRTARIRFTLI